MDKKIIGIIIAYTLIMGSLLIATFAGQWTPSGYDYSIEGETLTIEHRSFSGGEKKVNVENRQADALRFYVALSAERQQWRIDVMISALILPFILLLFTPERRPFKEQISLKWYTGIVAAIVIIYLSYTIPLHVSQVDEIQQYVNVLLK
ncbi:hypothetical protein LCL89_15480 [Halobacillus yeomjeoni]|uniref:hypothetical protein n=1 Tax=Halobacillus yeomjeoni TaxID=311194 RepID=UPI001CD43E08|nr:hypothetical protein [Halobacillus yeomjeoni]MCA0985436.1 hypothetical protein [Halobacillus yeomjeoni]